MPLHPTLLLTLALAMSLAPTLASAQDALPVPSHASEQTQGRPVVPRFQGPYGASPTPEPERRAWGFALLGTGAVAGGMGLYLLESGPGVTCSGEGTSTVCAEQDSGRVDLGAGLLIGGIFLSGLGFYLLVSENDSQGPVIRVPGLGGATTPAPARWRLGLQATTGGALLSSDLTF